ncbi:ABC transporter substrate-binding protein [Pseudoflavonifractor phocaeensis]|uniref:ABC transporter substrate-binding protein n=1 Tax=Pseudoflavonifractor phocaeensis TaxID=1870988 RepID=UPI001F26AA5A|nr:ABC transporter substrate-binding protein [Pseudoflavonifractor phocaeensis]MCF2660637.1 ABC transporter substrate-binding protein [Pseudoflavonifractor phocaeensis]
MRKLLCFILTAFLLAGCGGTAKSEPTAAEKGVTFTDDLGRAVTVDEPKRVAALIGSFADIWCLAGGKETLVAAAHDTWTSFDLGLDQTVADLGEIKEPNLELLLASQPDLVLASANTGAQVDLLEALEGSGLNVAYFKVADFGDYLRMLDVCTQITGQRENYVKYGQDLEEQRQAAIDRADGSRPTVLYVRATGSSCKVKNSQDSVLGEMLADLDCVNVADSETGLLEELSMEAILDADPRFIFVVLQGADPTAAQETLDRTLLSDPAWQSLTAVKEGRYHVMDHQLYNLKPNARWGEAYQNLADILYPER